MPVCFCMRGLWHAFYAYIIGSHTISLETARCGAPYALLNMTPNPALISSIGSFLRTQLGSPTPAEYEAVVAEKARFPQSHRPFRRIKACFRSVLQIALRMPNPASAAQEALAAQVAELQTQLEEAQGKARACPAPLLRSSYREAAHFGGYAVPSFRRSLRTPSVLC